MKVDIKLLNGSMVLTENSHWYLSEQRIGIDIRISQTTKNAGPLWPQ